MDLDPLDRLLLDAMQVRVPLVERPFAALGEEVGLSESEVLVRVGRLMEAGIIRQISAIFDTRRLGYQSTLVAFHIADSSLEETAARVSAHPGVSHNYARSSYYDLWFTLTAPPGIDLAEEVQRLAQQVGVVEWLNLPTLRRFKIKTHFSLTGDDGHQPRGARSSARLQSRELAPDDIPYARALQEHLPAVSRPFAALAERSGLKEQDLLIRARELEAAGIMRRFSAVLRHRKVGYLSNGMVCWVVPESRIEEVGQFATRFSQVSHCYQRPAYPPRWPYNLFTMIHGQTDGEVEAVVAEMARQTGLQQYAVLYSTHEFKKERVKYFQTLPEAGQCAGAPGAAPLVRTAK